MIKDLFQIRESDQFAPYDFGFPFGSLASIAVASLSNASVRRNWNNAWKRPGVNESSLLSALGLDDHQFPDIRNLLVLCRTFEVDAADAKKVLALLWGMGEGVAAAGDILTRDLERFAAEKGEAFSPLKHPHITRGFELLINPTLSAGAAQRGDAFRRLPVDALKYLGDDLPQFYEFDELKRRFRDTLSACGIEPFDPADSDRLQDLFEITGIKPTSIVYEELPDALARASLIKKQRIHWEASKEVDDPLVSKSSLDPTEEGEWLSIAEIAKRWSLTYRRVKTFLREHPGVRTKPGKKEVWIHLVDWNREFKHAEKAREMLEANEVRLNEQRLSKQELTRAVMEEIDAAPIIPKNRKT